MNIRYAEQTAGSNGVMNGIAVFYGILYTLCHLDFIGGLIYNPGQNPFLVLFVYLVRYKAHG